MIIRAVIGVLVVVVLLALTHRWLTEAPWSFRAQFDGDATIGLARAFDAPIVTESDLAFLPAPVQRYLRAIGVVGQPRVRNYRVHFKGRIRSAPDAGLLLDSRIQRGTVDVNRVRARFTNGTQTISATLLFDDEGLLTNFVSDDGSRASADGKSFTRHRFSTPVRDYRTFGAIRLPSHGDARYLLPEGEFTYGEFDLQDVAYNVRP